ncbi:bifunctional proline dehydrogenase/L-glutamate gamma-semialdehyde dehydrogenase PutA [Sphingomicrobium aestuariivivum]|uniref:bifunctional proline dehydrogenase/L-glutamate gamma-semialdehyde dehydrogenase PutA n=1 Tax=Sphingomicrobium aestuariivivum TaxID=1582356 RepID=UPI001FD6D0DE|nr:bifunctional proline dehydrogenase/L-glutamate gamma-semialdehyde dehydrogenase PutA [Sphingomicrobium aestuariivivum]MCJ8189943.1 bifunctional proline dehydrogenase/L-glutamate gamma-semialdehyde dehydrogenase PutA [Sphingomicrobium aestuariivivum]
MPTIDRSTLRAAYRAEENAIVSERIEQARLSSSQADEAEATAAALIRAMREHKAVGIDAFMQAYDLGSDEGIALMCLAEALLRIPDAETIDDLIHDKLSERDWAENLGASRSTFVNAATFSLLMTGKVLEEANDDARNWRAALGRAVGRLGEPVIRTAVGQAMKILGKQFVFGRTIDEALVRARPEIKRGLSHSFDMLGEAAMTHADAARYAKAYEDAIDRLAAEGRADSFHGAPGISVKLSALHPRYEWSHAAEAKAAILPVLTKLARKAADANVHLTVDAEEADRLELSLDIIEAIAADDSLFADGWEGFGMAIQAYQKRGVHTCDWAIRLAQTYRRKLFVRLVKGAYWDTEIKAAQVAGLEDYPVFTRKLGTDVSYLACARKLLSAPGSIFPAFATHNANTIAAIKAIAGPRPGAPGFEFQRLHGMGDELYTELHALEDGLGEEHSPVRIYAPVGSHKELLAYLVRRLLENGANSSFVNRIADERVSVEELVRDPVALMEAVEPKRNPAIPLPNQIFGLGRRNSAGVDLSDPLVREPLMARLEALKDESYEAIPTERSKDEHPVRRITSPHDDRIEIGLVHEATEGAIDRAMEAAAAAQPAWDQLGGEKRAQLLDKTADLFEEHAETFFSLCIREAGKTLPDAILEVREAVDFLRYYAAEARQKFSHPIPLPGPTGELNELRLHGRGVWTCISPWNFPLAIFTGPVAAALASGNAVMAKPAEQTPLIADFAIDLMHQAGIPRDIAQFMPGDGKVGAALVAHPLTAGVAFTGSTETARIINRTIADRQDGPIVPLIAETGGQNAMIVDSSALPEQVTRDVVASSFQSAGQRCSALRVLYIQDDVADGMIEMIKGALEAQHIGDPRLLTTDVGPVIDAQARQALRRHLDWLDHHAKCVVRRDVPEELDAFGYFVSPSIYEIESLAQLQGENFGPILHIIRWKAGELDKVVEAINSTGYGLTLGLQSRIDLNRRYVEKHARVGNLYVNRNQIGAVVESQPFGGEGLSGTGPKAGGPNYVERFATERVTCVDTTAAGGNASLMASLEG